MSPSLRSVLEVSVLPGSGIFVEQINIASVLSTANGLTALAGGGQPGATPLTAKLNRFTVVATAADSAVLPLSRVGSVLSVVNATANAMNVFPAVGESINALSANTAVSIPAGKTMLFQCAVAGIWNTFLGA